MCKIKGFTQWYYSHLVAWDINSKIRIYAILKTNKIWSDKLLNVFEGIEPKWPRWAPSLNDPDKYLLIQSYIESLVDNYNDKIFLLAGNDLTEGPLALGEFKKSQYGNLKNTEIDDIVNLEPPKKHHFFNLLCIKYTHIW